LKDLKEDSKNADSFETLFNFWKLFCPIWKSFLAFKFGWSEN